MRFTLPQWRKRAATKGRVGISLSPTGLTAVYLNAQGVLANCEELADAAALAAWVERNHCQGASASVVLPAYEYQLLLAEAPAVEAAEMASAIRWKLRDLVDFPVEQAACSYFSVPADAYRGRKAMIYVAVMRRSRLHELIDPLESAGLKIECVEVAELAINNLICRVPPQPGAQIVLHLGDNAGLINVVEHGQVYLTRNLEIPLAAIRSESGEPTASWDELLLEVQRSRDFYESQMGKGIVTHITYSPDDISLVSLGDYFTQQLGLESAPLELARYLPVADELSLAERSVATEAAGAALGPSEPISEMVDAAP